jgi:hypothetical protein
MFSSYTSSIPSGPVQEVSEWFLTTPAETFVKTEARFFKSHEPNTTGIVMWNSSKLLNLELTFLSVIQFLY